MELNKAFNIQNKYEKGELMVSEMTEEEYNLLQDAYILQIYYLDTKIENQMDTQNP